MSSIFKKKRKKKKAAGSRKPVETAASGQGRGPQSRQKRTKMSPLVRKLLLAGLAVCAIAGGLYFFRYRPYTSYAVVNTIDTEDTVSAKYLEMGGKLFRYSGDGASLEDRDGNVFWSAVHDMQNPIADRCDDTVAVADQGGTSIHIFNKKGELGSVETNLNIVKIKVASQGVVAAILDGGEDTWINFYATDGSLIAENQTRIDDPGYPLDLAVSKDGLLIMLAYQFVEGEETKSYVAFYNFAKAGENQVDNIVSGYLYEGVVVPQVEYLDRTTSVAFRDDGFSVFTGDQIPKESVNVVVEEEIVSTFYDETHIGLVFKNDGKDKLYTMKVYDTAGQIKMEKDFNIAYTNIRMSQGQIVMNNNAQACVITTDGIMRYNGNIDEGSINDFFKIGMNRYVLVMDNGVSTIKFR